MQKQNLKKKLEHRYNAISELQINYANSSSSEHEVYQLKKNYSEPYRSKLIKKNLTFHEYFLLCTTFLYLDFEFDLQ